MLEKIDFPAYCGPTLATVITWMGGSARFFFLSIISVHRSTVVKYGLRCQSAGWLACDTVT